ncbi:hypothetical protein ElyMa_003964600 [Elysia marginata]|uniref:Uncharacterized protein n=1 Tax=Elysia marginata TaxID=1093978 RepID=A0AAV4FVD4_9GAST|nr:hypothetical protein ElyMa_003964600 [Elysia marginata]
MSPLRSLVTARHCPFYIIDNLSLSQPVSLVFFSAQHKQFSALLTKSIHDAFSWNLKRMYPSQHCSIKDQELLPALMSVYLKAWCNHHNSE